MIIRLDNIDCPELDVYRSLTEAQLRSRQDETKSMFIAESPNVIDYALRAGYTPVSMLMAERHTDGAGREITERVGDIPIYTAEREKLLALTGFDLTRGILCAMRRKPLPSVSDVCRGKKRIAVLEHVTDPANIGSIFRSAAALGMGAVLLSHSCCDPLYRRAARVSMGGVFMTDWTYIDDWEDGGIAFLRKEGFTTAAMALSDDAIDIDDKRLKDADALALILGSEGFGLRQETIDSCDYSVKIPMCSGMDSLNVASAAAVAFWNFRQNA